MRDDTNLGLLCRSSLEGVTPHLWPNHIMCVPTILSADFGLFLPGILSLPLIVVGLDYIMYIIYENISLKLTHPK